MIHVNSAGEGFFKGDAVKLTGKKDAIPYDLVLYEFVIVSGDHKGECIWQPKESVKEKVSLADAITSDGREKILPEEVEYPEIVVKVKYSFYCLNCKTEQKTVNSPLVCCATCGTTYKNKAANRPSV